MLDCHTASPSIWNRFKAVHARAGVSQFVAKVVTDSDASIE